ncbi:hypothetical protein ID866_7464 [Astraeus odoratus]|nr:hypothetical protein ID866_7464 [Astraeus odoratus]
MTINPTVEESHPPETSESAGSSATVHTPLLPSAGHGVPKRRWKGLPVTMVVSVLALIFAFFFFRTSAKRDIGGQDGVGKLPVMGYNTWNAYHCDIDEDLVLKNAKLLKDLGLAGAGYTFVNIDDCYSERERNAAGDIVESKTKFPSGMRSLTDQIHALGLDAKLFQEDWGFDYLKYDNCAVPFDNITRENIIGRYARMSNAITDLSQATGKPPLILSLCEWGREQVWLWGRKYGQSWRTTDDIEPNWRSITYILNRNSFHAWANDFYGHNDMDMLEIGNGDLTYEEAKTHFTAWALLKSPLLIGTDLETASAVTIEILTNPEVIAINQDPVVGTSITPFRWGINPDYVSNDTHPAQYWSGQSQNGTVFMLINTLDEPATLSFNLTESPWIRAGRQYSVRDLWAHTHNGTAVRNFTAYNVPAHGVVALLLQDAGDEPEGLWPPCSVIEWCMSEAGVRIDQ